MEVNLTDLVNYILIVEGDEAKAPVPVGHLVVGEHALFHFTELLEVRLDVLQAGGGRQSSNKNLLSPHYKLGVRLARNSHLEQTKFNFKAEPK